MLSKIKDFVIEHEKLIRFGGMAIILIIAGIIIFTSLQPKETSNQISGDGVVITFDDENAVEVKPKVKEEAPADNPEHSIGDKIKSFFTSKKYAEAQNTAKEQEHSSIPDTIGGKDAYDPVIVFDDEEAPEGINAPTKKADNVQSETAAAVAETETASVETEQEHNVTEETAVGIETEDETSVVTNNDENEEEKVKLSMSEKVRSFNALTFFESITKPQNERKVVLIVCVCVFVYNFLWDLIYLFIKILDSGKAKAERKRREREEVIIELDGMDYDDSDD